MVCLEFKGQCIVILDKKGVGENKIQFKYFLGLKLFDKYYFIVYVKEFVS